MTETLATTLATWGTVALTFTLAGTVGTAFVLERRRPRYRGRHRMTF